MSTHYSSLNFYRLKERKLHQNLKCQKGDGGPHIEVKCKWNSVFELTEERGRHKNFIGEIFT
jgi:hypothetical protein